MLTVWVVVYGKLPSGRQNKYRHLERFRTSPGDEHRHGEGVSEARELPFRDTEVAGLQIVHHLQHLQHPGNSDKSAGGGSRAVVRRYTAAAESLMVELHARIIERIVRIEKGYHTRYVAQTNRTALLKKYCRTSQASPAYVPNDGALVAVIELQQRLL